MLIVIIQVIWIISRRLIRDIFCNFLFYCILLYCTYVFIIRFIWCLIHFTTNPSFFFGFNRLIFLYIWHEQRMFLFSFWIIIHVMKYKINTARRSHRSVCFFSYYNNPKTVLNFEFPHCLIFVAISFS